MNILQLYHYFKRVYSAGHSQGFRKASVSVLHNIDLPATVYCKTYQPQTPNGNVYINAWQVKHMVVASCFSYKYNIKSIRMGLNNNSFHDMCDIKEQNICHVSNIWTKSSLNDKLIVAISGNTGMTNKESALVSLELGFQKHNKGSSTNYINRYKTLTIYKYCELNFTLHCFDYRS